MVYLNYYITTTWPGLSRFRVKEDKVASVDLAFVSRGKSLHRLRTRSNGPFCLNMDLVVWIVRSHVLRSAYILSAQWIILSKSVEASHRCLELVLAGYLGQIASRIATVQTRRLGLSYGSILIENYPYYSASLSNRISWS